MLWSLFRLSNIQNTAHICGHFANNLVHSLSNPVLTFNLPPLAACKGKTLNWLKPLSEFKNLTPLMASWECLCCSKRNMTLTVRWRHHVECTQGAAGSVTDFPITFWRLSSITKQTHDNMESFCFIWFFKKKRDMKANSCWRWRYICVCVSIDHDLEPFKMPELMRVKPESIFTHRNRE